VVRGAAAVASQALGFARRAPSASTALVDGAPGLVVAPHGRPAWVLRFALTGDRIARIEVLSGPARLETLDLAPLLGP
jgi:hypothetical protein